jgi:hypothetical protein
MRRRHVAAFQRRSERRVCVAAALRESVAQGGLLLLRLVMLLQRLDRRGALKLIVELLLAHLLRGEVSAEAGHVEKWVRGHGQARLFCGCACRKS